MFYDCIEITIKTKKMMRKYLLKRKMRKIARWREIEKEEEEEKKRENNLKTIVELQLTDDPICIA